LLGGKLKIDFTDWHRTQGEPTTYGGTAFRSRTEARWAVFFDALGIEYEYETPAQLSGEDPDSYTGATEYTAHPDFWLPRICMWAEVKSDRFDEEEVNRARILATQTFRACILLAGEPSCKQYRVVVSDYLDADRIGAFTFAEGFGVDEAKVREAVRVARSTAFGTRKRRSSKATGVRQGLHVTENTAARDHALARSEPGVEVLPEAGPTEMFYSSLSPYAHWIEKADRDLQCTQCGQEITSGAAHHRLPYGTKLCDECFSSTVRHDWSTVRKSQKRGPLGGGRSG